MLAKIDNNCSTRFAPPKTGHTAGTTKQVETYEASFASRSLLSSLQEATENAHRIFGGCGHVAGRRNAEARRLSMEAP